MVKVCMLVMNPVTDDSRVLRQASLLSNSGYDVVVWGIQSPGSSVRERLGPVEVARLHPTPEIVHQARRFLPRLFQGLRSVYRRLMGLGGQSSTSDGPASQSRIASLEFMLQCNLRLARRAVREAPDILHAHDLDTLLAGFLVSRWTGCKLVYDYHEIFTQQSDERGPGVKLLSLMERTLIGRTDLRLTVCDSLGYWSVDSYGTSPVHTILNVPELSLCRVQESPSRLLTYHGRYFPGRGLEELLEMMVTLPDARLLLRGNGPLESLLRQRVEELELQSRVEFRPPVPPDELIQAASEAGVGVLPILDTCLNHRLCLPNKLFEYMMAGLAIVAADCLPEVRHLVLSLELGILVDPKRPEEAAAAISNLLQDEERLRQYQQNSRQAAKDRFHWGMEGQRFLELYRELDFQ